MSSTTEDTPTKPSVWIGWASFALFIYILNMVDDHFIDHPSTLDSIAADINKVKDLGSTEVIYRYLDSDIVCKLMPRLE
jgi:hypothetical protein